MENDEVNYIADLDTGKDTWKLKVRILNVCKTTYSMDMIVMDERSDKIQASVKIALCPVFEGLISEGTTVLMSKFGVGDNSGKYPALQHRYKLNFYRATVIKNDYEEVLEAVIDCYDKGIKEKKAFINMLAKY